LNKVNQEMEKAMEQLSSGKRINSAGDDAAGLSIATRMESQVRGLNQAMRNAADGQSMVDTAEGAMDEISNMLQRMRELALQSASDTMNSDDRVNLNAEIDQLIAEVDRVTDTTTFNGKNLLNGTSGSQTLQIGNLSGETLSFSIGNMSSTALGTTLTNAAASEVTGNIATGVPATATVSQMAFNGNDTYGFSLTVGDGAGGTEAVTIALAAVVGNDAQDVADKINTAISTEVARDGTTLPAGAVTATANGNVVTLSNTLGDTIAVASFTSSSNGSASYTSTVGAGTAKLLDETDANDGLINTNNLPATATSGNLVMTEGKDYSFRLNDELITFTNLNGSGGTSAADALAAMKLAIGDGSASSAVVDGDGINTFTLKDSNGADIAITNLVASSTPAGSPGTMVMTVRENNGTVGTNTDTASNTFSNGGSDTSAVGGGDIVQMSFTDATANYTFEIDGQSFTVDVATAGSLSAALNTVRDEITAATDAGEINNGTATVAARVVDGKLELENLQDVTADGTNDLTIDEFVSTGAAAVSAGAVTLGGSSIIAAGAGSLTNGTVATPSQMSLTVTEDDTYSFTIGSSTVNATVSGGSLDSMISSINALSDTTSVTARLDGSQILLERADGQGFTIDNFTSTGTGTIQASNAASQGGSAVLDDTAAVTGANTAAAGVATATTMDLSMNADDDVTFKISDGRTNAVVRLTSWDVSDSTSLRTEISNALANAGSDITVQTLAQWQAANVADTSSYTDAETAAETAFKAGPITLTNAQGGEVEISNFTSDATGVMTATPGSGQGVGKLLDDTGVSASQSAVSAINITSSAGANSAIAAIDRALEQINSQRSNLGAISNRLDHTISNLGNVVINTEASQSRIEDADFAKVTGDLTKSQIMSQAATAMLAQANASKQGVLSLLQG
jgi:flagellin